MSRLRRWVSQPLLQRPLRESKGSLTHLTPGVGAPNSKPRKRLAFQQNVEENAELSKLDDAMCQCV